MIERTDELPEAFWTENELNQMAIDAIEIDRFVEEPTNLVFYHLFKNNANTGLVIILAVKSVLDGQEAIDRFWSPFGLTSIVGEYNDESYLNKQRAEALYLLLSKYTYEGKQKLPCSDKVYKYEPWMGKLI